jgi:hypothetical protein
VEFPGAPTFSWVPNAFELVEALVPVPSVLECGESGTGVVSFRGASHHGHPVETREYLGQSRSLLKYANCGECINLVRNVCPLEENSDFY